METAIGRRPRGSVLLTETDYPTYQNTEKNPQTGRKWRKGYPGPEIPHHWSRNQIPHGEGGNIYFRDGIIFSYGPHFPIARHVKCKRGGCRIILFTTDKYGPTTAKHISYTRRSIPDRRMVFEVPDVMANTRERHLGNLSHFRTEAREWYERALAARLYSGEWYRNCLAAIDNGNRYAEAVGLTERLGSPTGGDLEQFREECEEKIEAAKAKLVAYRKEQDRKHKEQRAREEARLKVLMDEWNVKVKEWEEGKISRYPECPVYWWKGERADKTRIRVSRYKFLQTSLGMSVHLEQVKPILEAIRAGEANGVAFRTFPVRARGSEWEARIDWTGKCLRVGCHLVEFSEIERACKLAGL